MDRTQDYLFGKYPRRVANPNQWWVFGEGEMEAFLEASRGKRNAYATVAWFDLAGTPISDKVAYDFDSPRKESAFPNMTSDAERMEAMLADPGLALTVLEPVLKDVRSLVEASQEDGIPVAGVFSGMGVHVYQLYQPRYDPADAMRTTALKYIKELELETADVKVSKDVQRILRVPNMERVDKHTHEPTGFYTIPLSGREMIEWDAERLMDMARLPRPGVGPMELDWPSEKHRPAMEVVEEYLTVSPEETEERALELPPGSHGERWARAVLEDLLQMPCMYDRLCQPNPDHTTRVNSVVLLYNAGLKPRDVEDLLMALNFRDQDRAITRKQVEQIWRGGYADMSCETLRAHGLCTRSEDPQGCPTYGWRGGNADWVGGET